MDNSILDENDWECCGRVRRTIGLERGEDCGDDERLPFVLALLLRLLLVGLVRLLRRGIRVAAAAAEVVVGVAPPAILK